MNNTQTTEFKHILAASDREFANYMLQAGDGPCLVPSAKTEAARSEVFRHIKQLIVCAYLECNSVRKTHDAIVVFDNIRIAQNSSTGLFRIIESPPNHQGKSF